MTGNKQGGMAVRAILAAAGAALLALTGLLPTLAETRMDVTEARSKAFVAAAGETLERQVELAGNETELSVSVTDVKEAGGLTMTLTLLRDQAEAASAEASLARVKARSRVQLPIGDGLKAGAYTLRLSFAGEGQVGLMGDKEGGELAVRLIRREKQYAVFPAYLGALLLILAATPGAGKGEKKHG